MSWRRRASHSVAVGALAACLLVWAAHEAWPSRQILVATPIVVTNAYDNWADTLGRREILSDVLARAGISGREYASFMKATRSLDARRMQPGLIFEIRRLKGADTLPPNRLAVRLDPERRVVMSRLGGDSGWSERVENIPWTAERLRTTAVIQTNLYDALDEAIPDSFLPARQRVALAWAIADVYDWEVDFSRDVRPGDRVEVLLERLQSPNGERRFGRILAARVDVAGSPSFAFAFDNPAGVGRTGFYDDRGRSLRRAFLLAPLRFSHISSRFGNRFHPILKRWRNHEGTDFAAAYGTPVRATADGIVTHVGREGGYGNLIEIRHANGIRTRYGHLSRFATGLHVGQHVSQQETIGYVGSTGLSTGPHLHYEFLVNGRPTNPQRKDAGAGEPVAPKLKSAFDAVRAQLFAELEPPAAPVVSPALGSVAGSARED
jgi:murein DD-endopeptidase MepM/ murein hydrolase activator NlpD